jgi:transcription initiation factor TFIIF subunit alpha
MWTMKMRMKLKNKDEEEAEVDPEETKAMKSGKSSDKKKLQISEMDEWMDSDDMSSSEDEGEDKKKGEDDSDKESKMQQKKEKGKKLQNLKKKKKRDVDDEAFEVNSAMVQFAGKPNFLFFFLSGF